MKPGELRQFFLSAYAGGHPDVSGKIFLVVSSRHTRVDFLMDGVLHKGWSLHYLNSNSKVLDETR